MTREAPLLDAPPAPPGTGELRRAAGAMLAGAMLAGILEVAAGFALDAIARNGGSRAYTLGFRAFLNQGGWLWLPLWGAALAGFRAAAWASTTRRCALVVAAAAAVAAIPFVLRPVMPAAPEAAELTTVEAKTRAIRRWSYRSPDNVAKILALASDPDPKVREQAMLAMGVNLIVTDVEHASDIRPSQYAALPLRDSLRARLLHAMRDDPIEAVRAEAGRALWKAPITFGRQPVAAETLAAILDRAAGATGTEERLAWLAIDAAAADPDPGLKRAAAHFAATTPDSDLAKAARLAVGP